MQMAKNIMSRKLYTIDPLTGVGRAAAIMERCGIGCLPVVDEGKLVGIITSRDIKKSHPNRLVADAMTKEVITVPPTVSIWEAKKLMEEYKIERLVVVDEKNIVGIITKAQIIAELSRYIDSLTGLNKAEVFYERARQLLKKGHEIAVIFLDIDNFGLINKEYGHVYGDNILRKVAVILDKLVDKNRDTLCRYAGDEFAVVTTRPLEEAEKFALQLVMAFANEKWPAEIKITISVGVAGGRRSGIRNLNEDSSYIVKNLINMASLASTKAKKLKRPVVVVDAIEFKEMVRKQEFVYDNLK